MIALRAILVAAVMGMPGLALGASPVTVAGGEHPDFTRLVLDFDARPEWTLSPSARGYRLEFDAGEPLAFDLSRVFRLIGRDRVADIRTTPTGLEIDLGCDCQLAVDALGTGAVVIDVRPERKQRVPDTMPPLLAEAAPTEPPSGGPMPSTPDAPDTSQHPATSSTLPWLLDQLGGIRQPMPDSLVDLVGREFSRAAAQGLVDATPQAGGSRRGSDVSPGAPMLDDRSNLSVTTVLDRAIGSDRTDPPPTDAGMTCLSDDLVDVAEWLPAEGPAELGPMRAAAVAEDGSIEPDGALDLARFYLSIGFGAEALVAAEASDDPARTRLLVALAQIMDKGQTPSAIFEGQIFCEGHVALWAALARPLTPADAPASTDHILSTFSELPPHLRAHLGPTLAERLHDAGLDVAARAAINAVTRGGKQTKASELATARLDLGGNHADHARSRLETLSDGTDTTAAAALLELLLDAEERGLPPNPAWVEDAPTLVGALEGIEVAAALNLAGLRGLIALDRYAELRAAIVEETPGLTPDTRRDLAAQALRAVAARGDDRQFLETEIAMARLASPQDLDRATRLAIGTRYTALGLAGRGVGYLPPDAATPEELKVAVETLVAAGRAAEAVALLSAIADAPADLLGEALIAAGRDRDAIPALASVGQSGDAARAAIRTADWSWLSGSGPAPLAAAARDLVNADGVPAIAPDAPNGSLIERSRGLRESIDALLGATDPEAPPFTN